MNPCPKCGYHNSEDASRCINCGYDFFSEDDSRDKEDNPISQNTGTEAEKRKNNKVKISGLVLLILIILLILFWGNRRAGKQVNIPQTETNPLSVTQVAAMPGGKIPTLIPTITPTFLSGMESPVFCKLEMAMLHNKAEELGISGMLIPDGYEQPSHTCIYAIRNGITEIGHIRTVNTDDENFGVSVEITSVPKDSYRERMETWGTVVLLALDKEFTMDDVKSAMESVMETGTAALHSYELEIREQALNRVCVLSVTKRSDNI